MKKTSLLFAVLIALISGLLLFTTVGSVSAVLNYQSENYNSEFAMKDIGITLQEKGEKDENFVDVGWRDYQINDKKGEWRNGNEPLFSSIDNIEFGRQYSEQFRVKNTGSNQSIDEYVRVKVYKYWVMDDGKQTKNYELDPAKIILKLGDTEIQNLTGERNGWVVDHSEDTVERTVMYYTTPIKHGEATGLFIDSLTIDSSVTNDFTRTETTDETGKYRTITYTYKYDGNLFCVEIEADAIQTHNADKAIKSVWGRNVTIDKGTKKLSLVND